MTAESVTWRISADDAAKALRTLQDADKALTERLHNLNGANVDRWPGYQLRVHAESGTRLFADRDHGREIEEIAEKILKHGLRAGIRLEIQW